MGRSLVIAAVVLLAAGCGGSGRSDDGAGPTAPTPQDTVTTPLTPDAPASDPAGSPSARPGAVPADFPLAAGWGAGGGDGRPHAVHRPVSLDVHGIEPYVPGGVVARRTMVFNQPEWMRQREVALFGTPAAARAVVDKAIRLARADSNGMAEDGSTYLREVQLRRGGIVVVLNWARLQGHARIGTSSLILHRSGRALLISTDSTEGLGRGAALRLADDDLRDLRAAIIALNHLG